jgi:putative AdoMet-dependent methyltransferase
VRKDVFDKWAENYDKDLVRLPEGFPLGSYHEVLDSIFRLFDFSKGLKVIDVGVGTGILSQKFSHLGCSVFGIDYSSNMLEKARSKIPEGNFDLVDIAYNHFGKFNDDKFDRVVSNYFFHHLTIPEKIRFFEMTIKNNLKPYGKIIIGDIGFQTRDEFDKAHNKFIQLWDDEEFYLCGDEITSLLFDVGIMARYNQISNFGGILYYE